MKITILHGGKFKQNFYKEAIFEYTKRINRYIKINIEQIEKKINFDKFKKALVIGLSADGKNLTTDDFKKQIESCLINSRDIVFILGDPFGMSESIEKIINLKISLGKQTMQHELTFVVLLEQIYRVFTIIRNEPYHK
jgi:23S rRNA (pseudouridine1915-N3)-methyltransferase